MRRNRLQDSSQRVQAAPGHKVDLPVLVVSALTVFFATVFVTLLLMRPESSDSRESMRGSLGSVEAPPPVELPPVDAPPPELDLRFEPKPDPIVSPTLRAQLEQLGVKCAEGANCYSD
jgi:hypothetical protein